MNDPMEALELKLEARVSGGERLTGQEWKWLKLRREAFALFRELHGLDPVVRGIGDIAEERKTDD